MALVTTGGWSGVGLVLSGWPLAGLHSTVGGYLRRDGIPSSSSPSCWLDFFLSFSESVSNTQKRMKALQFVGQTTTTPPADTNKKKQKKGKEKKKERENKIK